MKTLQPKKGDLVFIPSGATLIRMSEGVVGDWVNVEEPISVVVADVSLKSDVEYYSVIYNGSSWLARPTDCYEVNSE